MRIVADENIPFVREAFSPMGDVRLVHGRRITPDTVRDAELLLVRSITKVNAALLEGSAVRFVATATIGTDHVDEAFLRQAGIDFASAPGSNANSVAEYIVAALLELAERRGLRLEGMRLGVVGVGNVGRRVEAKARALGMRVLLNDPPLQRATNDPKYRPLEELLDADALTFHVPLQREGPDATRHMIDATFLDRLRPDAILLNTSRGAVADNAALLDALRRGRTGPVVLDVWEGEPNLRVELLERAALGTPHIAGYSFDGKVNGAEMIYRAACRFLGREPEWRPADGMPPPDVPSITLPGETPDVEGALREAVRRVYSIERDDAALRHTATLPSPERGPAFDRLRKEYPRRREFQNTTVACPGGDPGSLLLRERLAGVGFRVSAAG
jgi:erythronate-4-phosphate dehydrogenase